MKAQAEQSAAQIGVLEQQLAQQAQIAEEQRTNLLKQLEAAGNAASTNYLSALSSLLSQQTQASQAAKSNRQASEAQDTQTAVQQTRANASQAKAQEGSQSILSNLARKRKRYVG